MPDIAYVNGRCMPLVEATVSIDDRGFQFGDGVYEVIRTYQGVPFQLDAHLHRLERSATAISLKLPFSTQDWSRLIDEGVRLGGYEESKVYLQVTRGVAPRDHLFPQGGQPTTVITIRDMRPFDPAIRESGVAVVTLDDFRWGRCDIKSVNLLPNLLARQQAKDKGAFEAIFVRAGLVTEGSVSNVMVIRDDVLFTPPEDHRILSGVTRAVVLNLARKEHLTVKEQDVSVREVLDADEVFLTGTTVEILPVVRIDAAPIGTGHPGPVSQFLAARFRRSIG